MKITALLVLKASGGASESSSSGSADPVILANATDVSHFGFFQRGPAKEFIVFVGRTVAKRTPPGQRQSVQHEEYKVHSYNRNGLCALAFTDDHYPVRSAFSLLNKVLDEYQKAFGESWRSVQADSTQLWPYLNDALTKFQDPAEADKLLKIQRDLDETKIILVQVETKELKWTSTSAIKTVQMSCGVDARSATCRQSSPLSPSSRSAREDIIQLVWPVFIFILYWASSLQPVHVGSSIILL